jgi:voltage-gated potassium channel
MSRETPGKTTEAREGRLQRRIYEIIFEADTPLGKLFDVTLLIVILASVLAVSLDSVEAIHRDYHDELIIVEWFFTALFSIEFILRLLSVRRPFGYVFSFYGIVDLLAILPSFVSLLLPGTQHLLVIRILRLLRIFRVLKLGRYVSESQQLVSAIRNSRAKIFVFLFSVLTLVVVIGAAMYLIEGPKNGFTSIPRAMYWAIVTLTTVGYGDITPQTVLGQLLSSMLMIMGYGIIAIPTGIVTAELTSVTRSGPVTTRTCPSCLSEGHRAVSHYCSDCGEALNSVDV